MQVRLVLLILFQGCFWQFCRFCEPRPSFQAWLCIGADLCKFLAISSSRDEEMSSGTELMLKAMQGVQDFRYGIAKISQGLRKFCYAQFCAMIAKIRYHSENSIS